jgi:glycolate oxidase FAD binding subunit
VDLSAALTAFAVEVGERDPVTCLGGGTADDVGGPLVGPVREVRAPSGIAWVAADEMTASCGAGTPVEELLAAVGEVGQEVALPVRGPAATVGGALSVGRSDVLRLGRGPLRDTLLQAHVVTSRGLLAKAGGPTVKNVSGYDLCRLLVGSLGTLALLGDVIVRTRPRPAVRLWFSCDGDPGRVRSLLHRPSSLLWDGATTWVCLEGDSRDVTDQARRAGLAETSGPPQLPGRRWSVPPSTLRSVVASLPSPWVAEVGVGIIHTVEPQPVAELDSRLSNLNKSVKQEFDPRGRFNPGRTP